MSNRIPRLQELLARVRRNGALPRSFAGSFATSPQTAVHADVSAPVAAAAGPTDVAASALRAGAETSPASSRRPKALPELELSLGAPGDAEDSVTPPPESGPQVTSSPPPSLPIEMPGFDSVPAGSLRSAPPPADLVLRVRGGVADGPTVEQLGNTLDLGDARGPVLELASEPEPVEAPGDDLEMPLPRRAAAGTYDEALVPPPSVHEDLKRHRDLIERYSLVPPEPPPPAPGSSVGGVPSVFSRSESPDNDVAMMVNRAQQFQPTTFIEWLDSSLALLKK